MRYVLPVITLGLMGLSKFIIDDFYKPKSKTQKLINKYNRSKDEEFDIYE